MSNLSQLEFQRQLLLEKDREIAALKSKLAEQTQELDLANRAGMDLEAKLAAVRVREIEALTELRKRAEELESVQAQAAEMRQNVELHCAAISYKPFYLDKALSSDAGRALLDELEALREVEKAARLLLCFSNGSVLWQLFLQSLNRAEEVRRKA